MESNTAHYTGSCLCGGVRFRIRGAIGPVQICHCQQCRKAQGAALVTNAPVSTGSFSLESGDELLTTFNSSPGKHRAFCKTCGSPIYSRLDSLPGVVRIRLGLINEDIETTLGAHYYVTSKANWWPVCDTIEQFEAGPESKRLT